MWLAYIQINSFLKFLTQFIEINKPVLARHGTAFINYHSYLPTYDAYSVFEYLSLASGYAYKPLM